MLNNHEKGLTSLQLDWICINSNLRLTDSDPRAVALKLINTEFDTMSNASASHRKSAQESSSNQPVLRAETATDQNPRRYVCPHCQSQQVISGSVSNNWLSRLLVDAFHCVDCNANFRKIPLRVWFAVLFLGWSLAMLIVTLLK